MKIKKLTACILLGMTTMAAQAADNFVSIGYSNITVHSKSPNLTSNGPDFLTPQPAGVKVEDASTLIFSYTRRLSPNFDGQIVLGVPPAHGVTGTGKLQPFGELARIKQAAPTAFLNYNFTTPESVIRPYVGLGVNFTHFYNATSSASGNIATGGPTKIRLTNSAGLAGQVGLSWMINKDWALNGSVATAKVETDMTTITGSIERKTTVDMRPIVYTLALTYGF